MTELENSCLINLRNKNDASSNRSYTDKNNALMK